jgi:hypothetical protein
METENDHWEKEMQKCKASPYYFATTYLTQNGEKFTTQLSEKDFNEMFLKNVKSISATKVDYSDVKFEKATKNNCIRDYDHQYRFIEDKFKRKAIRKQFPRMVIALWECVYCGKIVESM